MNEQNAIYAAKLDDSLNVVGGQMMAGSTADFAGNYTTGNAWSCWQNWHYPEVILQSYPVYIQERAKDKGKQAFEIIKMLKDKRLIKLETVGDFIDAMDELIKIL